VSTPTAPVPKWDRLTATAACIDMVNRLLIRAMNRLSPLIVRRVGRFAPALIYPAPFTFGGLPVARWQQDLKLFATGWIGGLVVFGTFFG
jgi:hypothetical protein